MATSMFATVSPHAPMTRSRKSSVTIDVNSLSIQDNNHNNPPPSTPVLDRPETPDFPPAVHKQRPPLAPGSYTLSPGSFAFTKRKLFYPDTAAAPNAATASAAATDTNTTTTTNTVTNNPEPPEPPEPWKTLADQALQQLFRT